MLLAALGGIFGFCLGGSFLSLIELLHFMIMPLLSAKQVKSPTKKMKRLLKEYDLLASDMCKTTSTRRIKPTSNNVFFISNVSNKIALAKVRGGARLFQLQP